MGKEGERPKPLSTAIKERISLQSTGIPRQSVSTFDPQNQSIELVFNIVCVNSNSSQSDSKLF